MSRRHDLTVTARIHDALDAWAPYAAEMARLDETWEIDPDDTTWRVHQSYRAALMRPRVPWWPEYVVVAGVADIDLDDEDAPDAPPAPVTIWPPGQTVAASPAPAHAPPMRWAA